MTSPFENLTGTRELVNSATTRPRTLELLQRVVRRMACATEDEKLEKR